MANCFTPGTWHQIQAAWSWHFWWLLIPVLTTSLSQRHLLPSLALCDTDSPLCYVDMAVYAPTVEITQQVWCGDAALEVPCMHGTISQVHSCLISASTEILKRLKKMSRVLLKRLGPKRHFRVNALPQFLSLLLLDLRLQVGLKASSVPFQQFSIDD